MIRHLVTREKTYDLAESRRAECNSHSKSFRARQNSHQPWEEPSLPDRLEAAADLPAEYKMGNAASVVGSILCLERAGHAATTTLLLIAFCAFLFDGAQIAQSDAHR